MTDLLKALEPFSEFAANVDENGWTSNIHRESISTWFGPSDFRRAREAFTGGGESGDAVCYRYRWEYSKHWQFIEDKSLIHPEFKGEIEPLFSLPSVRGDEITDDMVERAGLAIALHVANNDTPSVAARGALEAALKAPHAKS